MNVFTQIYNTAEGVIKTEAFSCRVMSSSTVWDGQNYLSPPSYFSSSPSMLQFILIVLGSVFVGLIIIFSAIIILEAIRQFLIDIHTIAENSKKKVE